MCRLPGKPEPMIMKERATGTFGPRPLILILPPPSGWDMIPPMNNTAFPPLLPAVSYPAKIIQALFAKYYEGQEGPWFAAPPTVEKGFLGPNSTAERRNKACNRKYKGCVGRVSFCGTGSRLSSNRLRRGSAGVYCKLQRARAARAVVFSQQRCGTVS